MVEYDACVFVKMCGYDVALGRHQEYHPSPLSGASVWRAPLRHPVMEGKSTVPGLMYWNRYWIVLECVFVFFIKGLVAVSLLQTLFIFKMKFHCKYLMVNPNGVQLIGTLVQVRALTERESDWEHLCLSVLVSFTPLTVCHLFSVEFSTFRLSKA